MAAGLGQLLLSVRSSRQIQVTETEIVAPMSGFSSKLTVVKLTEVQQLSVQVIQGHRFLNIVHRGGKLMIIASHLASQQDFEDLHAAIQSRAGQPSGVDSC
jgi:hypothetical protein